MYLRVDDRLGHHGSPGADEESVCRRRSECLFHKLFLAAPGREVVRVGAGGLQRRGGGGDACDKTMVTTVFVGCVWVDTSYHCVNDRNVSSHMPGCIKPDRVSTHVSYQASNSDYFHVHDHINTLP